MAISLAKAIVCLEDEPRIIKKIVVLTVLAILASVIQIVTGVVLSGSFEAYIKSPNPSSELLGSLLVFPITIYIMGFVFQSMHKTFNSDKFQMVELSQKNLMIEGFKYWFGILLYSIMISFISAIVFSFAGFVLAILSFIITMILGLFLAKGVATTIAAILACSAIVVVLLYIIQFFNVAITSYIKTLQYDSLFSIDKHFNIIKNNQHAAWSLIGKNILFILLFILVFLILLLTIIGVLLIPSLLEVAMFVYYNLFDQYAKEIQIEKYL